ncbi:MarR family transcriptional regulator [Pseudovibrio sp. Tun.PSC04-5.I4]|uniref:MarR family winged helix-turn-helix transcriptional regulator n=1 Tax=Pseudovibrio sp. Tun.PSC04-5.I4 TaxID=1798213 RepID=UPI00088B420D|nr:MarR family transcriptional regulator [Pseudovibrio sp. Tun.PSC04-5.I4]SDQ23486.1 DNA-binding transcriptional regulator, MarR family [Pseudovibrio sp. Tun.PSC04-5.I4]
MMAKPTNTTERDDFQLGTFFPYKVRVFGTAVSAAVSSVYRERYGLSVSEWRTMAILGRNHALSASEIVERSSMDKVNVSRAVQSLRKKEFLRRDIDGEDRRKSVLRLTAEGLRIFKDVVPLVRDVETALTANLSAQEQDVLLALMEKVQHNAEALVDERGEITKANEPT